MSAELLISASPGELRAALVAAGDLIDFRLARTVGGSLLGAIYLGRVLRLLPALDAALVEIGLERPAYLGAADALPRGDLAGLTEGAAILVQVKRDARADKAAAVSMRPRLVGRLLEWTPMRSGIAVDAVEVRARKRLESAVAGALAAGEGVRLLPAATHAPTEALAAEIAALRARWAAIAARRGDATSPACLERVPPLAALLTEFVDERLQRIVVDDAALLAEARAWLARERPASTAAVEPHRAATALFEAHGVAESIAALGDLRVRLPGGGALIIEPMATVTFIDVDSGALAEERRSGEEALLAVNVEAAAEIARQIRWRGLAGAIVVDFITLRRSAAKERLLAALRGALDAGAIEAQLLGWTKLGHVELIRPRRQAPLHEILYERGPQGGQVKSALTVALEALAAAERQIAATPAAAVTLRVHPAVAEALQGVAAPALQRLETRSGRGLAILAEPSRARDGFDIGAV